jgi:hypothetical protein
MADKNKTSFLREALVSLVKVQDLLYKNELDVIYYRVVKVGLGGKIIEYLTTKREIYC